MINDIDMIRELISLKGDIDPANKATLILSCNQQAEFEYCIDDIAVYSIPDKYIIHTWYYATYFNTEDPQKTLIVERGSVLYDLAVIALTHPQKPYKVSFSAGTWNKDEIHNLLEKYGFTDIVIVED